MDRARRRDPQRIKSADRYSGIPLSLLRRYRTVLVREADAEGNPLWRAELAGVPGCRASGATRAEALRRVRETAESLGARSSSARGALRQGAREDQAAPV